MKDVIVIKNIPNFITGIRIFLSVTLLFIQPATALFIIIYIISWFSDMLDGYIARKTKTTSEFGATLDSVADFLLITVLLIILIPLINLPLRIIIWISCIAVIRFLSLFIGFNKYHTLAFLHTYANKVTGFALFSIPLLYNVIDIITIANIVCFFASFSAIEELIINIKSKELNRDVKCIFDI